MLNNGSICLCKVDTGYSEEDCQDSCKALSQRITSILGFQDSIPLSEFIYDQYEEAVSNFLIETTRVANAVQKTEINIYYKYHYEVTTEIKDEKHIMAEGDGLVFVYYKDDIEIVNGRIKIVTDLNHQFMKAKI